jgi:hypothetical protein
MKYKLTIVTEDLQECYDYRDIKLYKEILTNLRERVFNLLSEKTGTIHGHNIKDSNDYYSLIDAICKEYNSIITEAIKKDKPQIIGFKGTKKK